MRKRIAIIALGLALVSSAESAALLGQEVRGGGKIDIRFPVDKYFQDYAALKRTGFRHVRLESFFGGHQLKQSEVRGALKWFRELGKF
jgi:hypothetical protein